MTASGCSPCLPPTSATALPDTQWRWDSSKESFRSATEPDTPQPAPAEPPRPPETPPAPPETPPSPQPGDSAASTGNAAGSRRRALRRLRPLRKSRHRRDPSGRRKCRPLRPSPRRQTPVPPEMPPTAPPASTEPRSRDTACRASRDSDPERPSRQRRRRSFPATITVARTVEQKAEASLRRLAEAPKPSLVPAPQPGAGALFARADRQHRRRLHQARSTRTRCRIWRTC